MGSVDWVSLRINESTNSPIPIVLPESDPNLPVTAITKVTARATLNANEVNQIGVNGTYYDLRVRLYEEDNSPWPWGDDTDDQIWQRRPRLQGVITEIIEVSVSVFIHVLRNAAPSTTPRRSSTVGPTQECPA